ncbi:MAG: S-layer homology domain-containing protein [Candidatus Saganbacteria bacterium]|nr:S-layer homology domain-containing protein [Candidatus Saganbacteria bacterium]
MKRKLLILLLAIMVLTSLAWSQGFTDVPRANASAYLAVQKLLKTGIISLPQDKKFNGGQTATMYQFASLLDGILKYTGKTDQLKEVALTSFYNDIPKDHYAYAAVSDLVKLGVFSVPEAEKFNGQAKLDRLTFYSYFASFLEKIEGGTLPVAAPGAGFLDLPQTSPYYIFIHKLIGAGLLNGGGYLRGEQPISRYEMAIFASRIIDYYLPQEEEPVKAESRAAEGYLDIPEDNYARPAIEELVEVGILPPGGGWDFNGDQLIDRYLLISFISDMIEQILGQLDLASPALSYKDVPSSSYAYRAVQKMIAAEVIPAGNRRELFYGDRRISRYQMVYFIFSAMEHILGRTIDFKSAPVSLGYADVSSEHFAYPTVQKLIWLGVLDGGSNQRFDGPDYVNKYELCYFTVNLIKAIYLKLEEAREIVVEEPADYGFSLYLSTDIYLDQYATNESYGQSYTDAGASQTLMLFLNRDLGRVLSVFAAVAGNYDFGSTGSSYPYLDQAYALINLSPVMIQAGRTSYYQGYTPFGNSIYMDTSSDFILVNYDQQLFNLNSIFGKLAYLGDIKQDSKFGTLSLSPKLPGGFDWVELTLGASLLTDLPDPDFTQTLNTNVTQAYVGLKFNVIDLFELSLEQASLDFSDPSVLPSIGYSGKDGFNAVQYAATYYSEDYGYSLSLGYQVIGDDYYLSTLTDTTDFFFPGQNTESYLVRTLYNPDAKQTVGLDLICVTRDNVNETNAGHIYYNCEVFGGAYLSVGLTQTIDNTLAQQNELNIATALSVTF